MSATNRSAARQADDFYETPAPVVRAILPHLTPAPVLDPFAGRGAILDVVRDAWSTRTYGLELDESRSRRCGVQHAARCRDAFSAESWDAEGVSIVSNPPYSRALEAIVRSAREAPRRERAFLLRLDFLGSRGRAAFHRDHPADVHVLPWRPEFVASMKCKAESPNGGSRGCGWSIVQPLDAPRPRACPTCGSSSLQTSTTDANEYGWFVYGPGRGGRWSILDIDPVKTEVSP